MRHRKAEDLGRHAVAAPPSSVMASRRPHSITSSARASRVWWNVDAHRLRGLEIDDQLKFGWQLDWQVLRFSTFQNSVDVSRCAALQVWVIHAIRDEAARPYK